VLFSVLTRVAVYFRARKLAVATEQTLKRVDAAWERNSRSLLKILRTGSDAKIQDLSSGAEEDSMLLRDAELAFLTADPKPVDAPPPPVDEPPPPVDEPPPPVDNPASDNHAPISAGPLLFARARPSLTPSSLESGGRGRATSVISISEVDEYLRTVTAFAKNKDVNTDVTLAPLLRVNPLGASVEISTDSLGSHAAVMVEMNSDEATRQTRQVKEENGGLVQRIATAARGWTSRWPPWRRKSVAQKVHPARAHRASVFVDSKAAMAGAERRQFTFSPSFIKSSALPVEPMELEGEANGLTGHSRQHRLLRRRQEIRRSRCLTLLQLELHRRSFRRVLFFESIARVSSPVIALLCYVALKFFLLQDPQMKFSLDPEQAAAIRAKAMDLTFLSVVSTRCLSLFFLGGHPRQRDHGVCRMEGGHRLSRTKQAVREGRARCAAHHAPDRLDEPLALHCVL
jgi:hypothetical protein